MTTTDHPVHVVLVLDHVGLLTVSDGMAYYLTQCCKASAKGSANSPTGVCCRKCYAAIDPEMGGAWLTSDTKAWDEWERDFRAYNVRLNAENATSPVLTKLVQAVRAQGEVK